MIDHPPRVIDHFLFAVLFHQATEYKAGFHGSVVRSNVHWIHCICIYQLWPYFDGDQNVIDLPLITCLRMCPNFFKWFLKERIGNTQLMQKWPFHKHFASFSPISDAIFSNNLGFVTFLEFRCNTRTRRRTEDKTQVETQASGWTWDYLGVLSDDARWLPETWCTKDSLIGFFRVFPSGSSFRWNLFLRWMDFAWRV